MKPLFFVLFLLACAWQNSLYAQNTPADSTASDTLKRPLMVVTKNDGQSYVGEIIKDDGREVLIRTENIGDVYIPKYEIKSIEPLKSSDLRKGEYVGEDIFATRHFFTTNALPIRKRDNYVLINLYGPEFHFAVAKNFSVGVMTTWIAAPIVASVKYSIPLGKKTGIGAGVLAGWGGPWFQFYKYGGALPYAAFTYGTRANSITLSAGYVYAFGERTEVLQYDPYISRTSFGRVHHSPLVSVAGIARLSERISFVFDSFIHLGTNGDDFGFLLMPGLRFQSKERQGERAFQFSLNILAIPDGGGSSPFVPIPVPMLGWFYRL